MKRVTLKTWHKVPKAVVMPKWLRKIPPFNELVYCERTYSNDYTSNTWTIVCMMIRVPLATIADNDVCRAVVYTGSDLQSTCLVIKTVFSKSFLMSVVRDAKHEFKLRK
jgi:hypothetical protein